MPVPTTRSPRLAPHLLVALLRRPAAAIDWLCNAFGFEVRLKVEGDGGRIEHSELVFGEASSWSATSRQGREVPVPARARARSGGANTQNLMVYVDDVEAHCAGARGRRDDRRRAQDHDYGEDYWADRGYECGDLGGHHWWFVERLAAGAEGVTELDADPRGARRPDAARRRRSPAPPPRRAGELAEALAMSPPAMSRHLRVLRETGLVDEERAERGRARAASYRLRPEPFDELRRWLDEVEPFWTGQLAAFKAHAERRARGTGEEPPLSARRPATARGDGVRARAPREAFDVFTREIDLWWRQGPRYRIAGRRRGQLAFEPGAGGRLFETFELAAGRARSWSGRSSPWEPPRRLALEWRGVNFAPDE